MSDARGMVERLETAFRAVEACRMADVPILNRSLRCEAVGMRRWQEDWCCVLVTPWFMNLMLLPSVDGGEAWPVGQTVRRGLPAGTFTFIAGEEAGVGSYLACSLFSPMFEFPDQQTAVATAEAALAEIMAGAASLAPPPEAVSRRRLFNLAEAPSGDSR
jgi:[NiFe] hydrogenase assembly HybE family chaperone